jgi:hypothetical protein
MKCAVEMGSGAMIYIPSFIKIGSDRLTHKPTFIFSKIARSVSIEMGYGLDN